MPTLAPHGYNLTTGGRAWTTSNAEDAVTDDENDVGTSEVYEKQLKTSKRSESTKELISTQLQAFFDTPEGQAAKAERSSRVQQQHSVKKLERFKGLPQARPMGFVTNQNS